MTELYIILKHYKNEKPVYAGIADTRSVAEHFIKRDTTKNTKFTIIKEYPITDKDIPY